jgi:hypothetical protein
MVSAIEIDHARPLIVCDADEVLLQFMVGLERFLLTRGCYFDLQSFRIHGNVKRQDTHQPVADEEVSTLLSSFFDEETGRLEMVPGAADALNDLSRTAQIVILSNLPERAREARIANLKSHGISFPVIAGNGPKGLILKDMLRGFERNVVFVDDLPPHISSVAAETPQVHRLHFIADPRLAKLLPACADAHRRIDTWPEARTWIASVIGA